MNPRTPLIAGNWKMYKTVDEATDAAAKLERKIKKTNIEVMIAPSFVCLEPVSRILKESHVMLGAQDMFWEEEGAYTGEVSARMLRSAGCTHVILGHSERRQYFGETDEDVNKKITAALAAGLIPILCVGETGSERDLDLTFSVLDKQVKKGLKGLSDLQISRLVIAYEPVWAIGTGKTATSRQAQDAHSFIRSLLQLIAGDRVAQGVRILYGGSVKPSNIAELMAMPDIDGALVGGASLDPDSFAQIAAFEGE